MKVFSSLKDVSVLLVEDNKINQMLLRKMIENLGCNVTTADNGIDALEKLCGANVFDIVLTDIQMPLMGGFELAKSIRLSDNTSLTMVPVVALTGYADDLDRASAKDSGIQEVLIKPFGEEEIKNALLRALGISPSMT
ncbi:MAG: response regulator [Arcticibacter sp.]